MEKTDTNKVIEDFLEDVRILKTKISDLENYAHYKKPREEFYKWLQNEREENITNKNIIYECYKKIIKVYEFFII